MPPLGPDDPDISLLLYLNSPNPRFGDTFDPYLSNPYKIAILLICIRLPQWVTLQDCDN